MQARLILGENWLPMRCSRWNICEGSRRDKKRYRNEQHWRSSAHKKIVARFTMNPVSHANKKST
jgi:hypothetical protein